MVETPVAAWSPHWDSPLVTLCIICRRAIEGPSVIAGESATGLHAECLAERLPYDAAVALIAAAALFVIPFIRVWSA